MAEANFSQCLATIPRHMDFDGIPINVVARRLMKSSLEAFGMRANSSLRQRISVLHLLPTARLGSDFGTRK
jgi:hypothetical protein